MSLFQNRKHFFARNANDDEINTTRYCSEVRITWQTHHRLVFRINRINPALKAKLDKVADSTVHPPLFLGSAHDCNRTR